MSELWQHAVTVFMGFFAIMNPVANTAVFEGLAGHLSKAEQIRTARRALLVAFVVVSAFALLGKTIFSLFGITMPALNIAGGIVVFLIGYSMLHGSASKMHSPGGDADGDDGGSGGDLAISPLAMPILAGPGTLATAMNFSASGGWTDIGVTVASFAVLCVVTFCCFVLGQRLVRVLGDGGIEVVTRVMGLIMAVIGVQMVLGGLGSVGLVNLG